MYQVCIMVVCSSLFDYMFAGLLTFLLVLLACLFVILFANCGMVTIVPDMWLLQLLTWDNYNYIILNSS